MAVKVSPVEIIRPLIAVIAAFTESAMELSEDSRDSDRKCEFVTAQGTQCKRAATVGRYCKQHYKIVSIRAKDNQEKKIKVRQPFWSSSKVAELSSIIGLIIGVIGLVITIALLPKSYLDENLFNSEIEKLRSQFYLEAVPEEEVIKQADNILKMKSSNEASLIKVVALTRKGRKDEARKILESEVKLSDLSQDQLIRKQYDLFIGTFDSKTGMSVFTSETSFSVDGKSVFVGPNLARKQYEDWIGLFDDVWLALPLFQTKRDYSSAPKQFFDVLIEQNPSLAWAYTMRAKNNYYYKDYAGSISDATKALELDGKQPYAYRVRALSYEFTNEYEKAIKDYNQSVKLQPNDPITYLDRGVLLRKMDRPHEAIEDYTKAIGLDPDFYQAYNNRGGALMEIEKYQEAIRDFSFVATKADESELRADASVNLISALVAKGDLQEAKTRIEDEDFAELLKQKGEGGEAIMHYLQGTIAEKEGNAVVAADQRISQWQKSKDAKTRNNAVIKLASSITKEAGIVNKIDKEKVEILRRLVLEGIQADNKSERLFSCFIAPYVLNVRDYEKLFSNWNALDRDARGLLLVGTVNILPTLQREIGSNLEAVVSKSKKMYDEFQGISAYVEAWNSLQTKL